MASKESTTEKGRQIGERIAQARQEAGGMAQRELAELLHVSERSIQAYEAGDVIPYRQLRELERVLGRSAAWFLHGDAATVDRDKDTQLILERLDGLTRAVEALAKKIG